MAIATIEQLQVGKDYVIAKNGGDAQLITDIKSLIDNSKLLDSLGMEICQTFKDVAIGHMYTSQKRILSGITIDYHHFI